MKKLSDFTDNIAREVPGAPEPLVESAVRDSAIDLCVNAAVWKHQGLPIDVRSGQSEYFIQPPRDGQLLSLDEAFLSGKPMWLVGEGDLTPNDALTGEPYYAAVTDNDRLLISPVPNRDIPRSLVIRFYCRPTEDAKTLPDILYTRYRKAVEQGALAIIKGIPNQEWTRQGDVAYHHSKQRKHISIARCDVIRNRHGGSISVRKRRFC